MCIIIYQPCGEEVKKTVLKKCWNSNRDGAGFMFCHDRKVVIRKGFFDFDAFYKAYRYELKHRAKKSHVVIHLRYATHGKVDKANCHPFRINNSAAFVHNGVIKNLDVPKSSIDSDTRIFNRDVLKNLPKKWWENESVLELLSGYIGKSKIVVMSKDGAVTLINEHLGIWDGPIWFSNTYYKLPRRRKIQASPDFEYESVCDGGDLTYNEQSELLFAENDGGL